MVRNKKRMMDKDVINNFLIIEDLLRDSNNRLTTLVMRQSVASFKMIEIYGDTFIKQKISFEKFAELQQGYGIETKNNEEEYSKEVKEFTILANKYLLSRYRVYSDTNVSYANERMIGERMGVNAFRKLTRDLFGNVLPRYCSICGSEEKLEIHHKEYRLPLQVGDLMRLCKSCHLKIHKNKKDRPDPLTSYGN